MSEPRTLYASTSRGSMPARAPSARGASVRGASAARSQPVTLVDLLERPSWFDVVRAGAIDGLAALREIDMIGSLSLLPRISCVRLA